MIREMACVVGMLSSRGSTSSPPKFKLIVNNSCGELKVNSRDRKPSIIDISLVFLLRGATYEASYETSFASVLYDFALRER